MYWFHPVMHSTDNVEAELLHTFTKVYKFDTMLLLVRLAVLTAVTLTVPIVLFPVSTSHRSTQSCADVHRSMPYSLMSINMSFKGLRIISTVMFFEVLLSFYFFVSVIK